MSMMFKNGPRKSDIHDFTLHFHTETEKGIKVSTDGNRANAFWLPKSQIEVVDLGRDMVEVSIPEWLAKEKELL